MTIARCLNLTLAFMVALTILPVAANGQDPVWPFAGPAFQASAEEILKAAAQIQPEKFTEATILFERDSYRFDQDGRVAYRHLILYRIESQAGVEGWAEAAVRYSPWYQNQPQVEARVILADGRVSQLDAKTVTDGPASERDDDSYTDDRIRKAPLPGLAIGAIVEEEIVVEDKQPFFAGGGVYRVSASTSVPVVSSEILVEAPATLKLQYRVHHLANAKISESEQDEVHHLQFAVGYMAARENADINLPTHDDNFPFIEFSTGESWAAVAKVYRALAEKNIDPNLVKRLLPIAAGATRLQTIQRLVARLHKEIRYTGLEFGQASLQPAPPAEILKHHYGDCKDKASVLVAMLRAAGVPASLALIDSGPGIDLTPELPGMNLFDHAIVYVPGAEKTEPAIWIDATAEYTQVGTLPSMDQGRKALIIAEDTTELTTMPEFKAEDDRLTEMREVVMAPYGSAHISETSLTYGDVDANYRFDFGEADTREKRENLESYVRSQYLANALTKVDHGDGKDLTKPFELKLEMEKAGRGNTGTEDASVGIPIGAIFSRLPGWFRTDPQTKGEQLTGQKEEDQKRAVAARADTYDVHPFLTEWHYRITPPEGFELRALPEDKRTELGPATFTQHYEQDSNGVIRAVLRFDTGKPHYSTDEALALRDAVLTTFKEDMTVLLFDQKGAKLLASGKTREALAVDRALIDLHPDQALQHVHMAYAYLNAGLGDRARAEALKATQLDSISAVAFQALGWICQFNEIGVRFGRGFDWDCAAEAYKKAIALDPDDNYTPINLSILEEFDRNGDRYVADAPMADAASILRSIIDKDKETGEAYHDDLFFDLLYSEQYKELLKDLDSLPSSVVRNAMSISATVAMEGGQKGVEDGIARADHLSAGASARNSALAAAGTQLLYLRMYPEAASVMAASAEGQPDSAATAQRVSDFRQLKRWNDEYLPDSDPRSIIQRMIVTGMRGKLDQKAAEMLEARQAYGSDLEWQRKLEQTRETSGALHLQSESSRLPSAVLLDRIAGSLKLSSEGNDTKGYSITTQMLGDNPRSYFVVKDRNNFKIVTDGRYYSESGNEALYLLNSGRDTEAQGLLDWIREKSHKGGGDDPLSGPLLPRFWSVGDAADHKAMLLAAASLTALTPAIRAVLPDVHAEWVSATNDDQRLNLELLLAIGYRAIEDGANLRAMSSAIIAKYPDSYMAIELVNDADALAKDWTRSKSILDAQLAKHPDDEALLRLQARVAEAQGNFEQARASRQKLFDNGKATYDDYNSYAWTGLFDGKIDDDVIKAAQQSNLLTRNADYGVLHTLACLYASQGRTAEAHDLLKKAMNVANLSEPNSAVWFALGLIYERYGVNDAAIEAYRKVEKPEGRVDPTDTWILAQNRLRALGAS